MALKRADIRTILENPETSNDDKAKAILDAHPGWADEKLVFLVPSTPAYSKMGEYFQASLKVFAHLGVGGSGGHQIGRAHV